MGNNNTNNTPSNNIGFAFYLKIIFVVFEVVGFAFTNSIAIISNAFHDSGDCIALALAYFLEKRSAKASDERYSYGYKRYSLLSSVILSIILIISSIVIIIEAVRRFVIVEQVNAQGMLWLSLVGIAVNLFVALKLHRGTSLNEKVVLIHIMKDLLSWIGVGVVSIVMMFWNVPILDAILSMLISLWVLFNIQKQLRSSVKIFLQAVPDGVSIAELKESLQSIGNVSSVENLHVWSLNGNDNVMSLKIVVAQCCDETELRQKIENIANTINVKDLTIEIQKTQMCEK